MCGLPVADDADGAAGAVGGVGGDAALNVFWKISILSNFLFAFEWDHFQMSTPPLDVEFFYFFFFVLLVNRIDEKLAKISVTRLGDLSPFGQLFKAFGEYFLAQNFGELFMF